jgi:hypothetical protein
MRRWSVLVLLLLSAAGVLAQDVRLPQGKDVLRFAVIGDSGTGGEEQLEIARQLVAFHPKFPFEFAIMLGDNLYGKERPHDYENKFEKPYKSLIDAGVKFYASLGNHDEPNQRFYKLFNMNGERYYSFKPKDGVRFFALDSNNLDQKQIEWLEKELAASGSDWKICFFHHPPYSSGERHGSNLVLREQLEPLFVKYGVSAVFTGHEHFYERIKPQQGILYFIVGSSGKLAPGDIREGSSLTDKGFDSDNVFLAVEIDDDVLYYQAITRTGRVVDTGTFTRRFRADEKR